MPKIVTVTLLCLLAGCAKPWPAAIASFDGLSPSEREAIEASITKLNKQAGSELVGLKENTERFPIYFKVEDLPSGNDEAVGGEADVGPTKCTVALSPHVFQSGVFETVVWHELGHCGGLDHPSTQGEVMSAEAHTFRNYPAARLERFVQALRQSTGLTSNNH